MNFFKRRRKIVKPRDFSQKDLKKFNARFKECMAKRGIETGKRAWLCGGTVA
jgi:hypothetical protein